MNTIRSKIIEIPKEEQENIPPTETSKLDQKIKDTIRKSILVYALGKESTEL